MEHEKKEGKKTMKMRILTEELLSHLPFSIFFTAAGMTAAGILLYVGIVTAPCTEHEHTDAHTEQTTGHEEHGSEAGDHSGHTHDAIPENPHIITASGIIFHLFHPIHLLLSALATTAMFWRHEKKLFKSVIIGAVGSLGVCGLSDIFMPYLSGLLLGVKHMHFHWCLIEHPQMVVPFVVLGIICGIIAADRIGQSTKFSHSSHIFVSVVASLFYLISYGIENWVAENVFPFVFVIVILAVTIPCCFSDIVFPVLTASCKDEACCSHTHT
jgi:hypothetical protein